MLLLIARWSLIVALSIVVVLPPIWAISSWAVQNAEEEHRATRPKPPTAAKDLEMGLRGLDALIAYTAGSFVILWPLSLWACYRLLRGIGQKRREPRAEPPAAGLLNIEPQVISDEKSAPGADFDEAAVAAPVLAPDDASRAARPARW